MELYTSILNDDRLRPLNQVSTVNMLQLFVLEQDLRQSSKTLYTIIYGWCITTSRNAEDKLFVSGAEEVYASTTSLLKIFKVSYYNTFTNAAAILNKLLKGNSLQEAVAFVGADATKMKFDVHFCIYPQDQNNIAIRPIIFNETNNVINRHLFERHGLKSPYKKTPSFSLVVNRLNKTALVESTDIPQTEWNLLLKKCLDYLSEETTLNFKGNENIRFGNIELINTQCADVYGKPYAWFSNAKKQVKGSISAREIVVTVVPNAFTIGKNLAVNCYLTNGGQIILDECKIVTHFSEDTLQVHFRADEEITAVVVTIWIEQENGSWQIWFKDGVSFLRQLSITMGIIGKTGEVRSSWLEVIEKSNKKSEAQVAEAKKISRSSYNRGSSIGGHPFDPWVPADDAFAGLIKKLNPAKSDAVFFSKAFNDRGEHGAVSFLEWFKKVTSKGKRVVFLDPFFDTLGLEFIARTESANTSFTVITCTQIKSNDDDVLTKEKWIKRLFRRFKRRTTSTNKEPNRAKRIKSMIHSNPSLFDDLKLDVYDLRSKEGGDANLLHDRYMIVYDEENNFNGFHLSNSIQGAAKNHPLLVTVIPPDIIEDVDGYLNKLISSIDRLQIIRLHSSEKKQISRGNKEKTEKKDERLFNKLKDAWDHNRQIIDTAKFDLKNFASELAKDNVLVFANKWVTLSEFYASVSTEYNSFSDQLKLELIPPIRPQFEQFIKGALLANDIYKFSENNWGIKNYLMLFKNSFEESLKFGLRINGYLEETFGHGSKGIYYACKFFAECSKDEYLKFSEFIIAEHEKAGFERDLSKHPITKLADVYLDRLLRMLYYYDNRQMTEKVIANNLPFFKGVGAGALIEGFNSVDKPLGFNYVKNLFKQHLNDEERVTAACNWYNYGRRRKREAEKDEPILAFIADELTVNYSDERLSVVLQQLNSTNEDSKEAFLTEHITNKLVEAKKATSDDIFNLWYIEFDKLIQSKESYFNRPGLVDITGWSFCTISEPLQQTTIRSITKQIQSYKQVIWKPFYKDTIQWNRAFERLLLYKYLLMLVLLYNDKNTDKLRDSTSIQALVDDIEALESNYQPEHLNKTLTTYVKGIAEKFH